MAIGIAAKALAKKLLKNKGLQKAINVTTTQTNKLKNAATAGASKVASSKTVADATSKAKSASKKVTKKAKEITKKATSKAKEVGSKVADKTPDSVKKVVSKTVSAGEKVVEGGGAIGALIGAGVGAAGGKAKGKALRATKDAIAKARGKPTKLGGTADRNMGKEARTFAQLDDTVDGAMTGADVGSFVAGGLIGAGGVAAISGGVSLTASMLKSTTPKEALFDVKKQPDGNFVTSFNDANKNKITSSSQLSSKEMGIVRGAIAGLDAILLSEDPRKERTMFNGYLSLLGKYGVTSVDGKNLSVNIAG
tara:strand:+ start:660 stop:1583 length:924 start_codon:yes stop_codon:yes gene_type:complete